MAEVRIFASDVQTAVHGIVPYLEDMRNAAPKVIYFDGWKGLAGSAVLRAIAEHPPPSLQKKFNKIIHIDCSMWKSRRALQMAIVEELGLTQQVASDFDAQEEEDDFSGVDQGSRAEIEGVSTVVARFLAQYRCLVIFHNGDYAVDDLSSCGIPQLQVFGNKVLGTFTGRLSRFTRYHGKIEIPHIFVEAHYDVATNWTALVAEEARELALYTHKLGLGVTPEIAIECCQYLLSLLSYRDQYGYLNFPRNWEDHAPSYWVCDGIVGGQDNNQAWELAHALRKQMSLNSPYRTHHDYNIDMSTKHWIFTDNYKLNYVQPETTSLFLGTREEDTVSLPIDMFDKADQLRVLNLSYCAFRFSSPPFHCCRNLRFLGLESCEDEQHQGEEEEHKGALAVDVFQRLWVLHVRRTNWDLALPLEAQEPVVATKMREVDVYKGRIWRGNLAWRRQLPNLRKLRVRKPTGSWETAEDEFMDMAQLEVLDLTGNTTMQVLPNLSGATNLKTLTLSLDSLQHVGPQGLPPSLELFECSGGERMSHISLAGCARLVDFRLIGWEFRRLVELDLSHTAVKALDLKHAYNLQRILLVGCEQLRSISWSTNASRLRQLRLLWIDTRAVGEVARKPLSHDYSSMACQDQGKEEYRHASVATADMRFLQSLVGILSDIELMKLNLCFSSSTCKDDGNSCTRPQLAAGSPLPKCLTYCDVSTEQQITALFDDDGGSSSSAVPPFQPLDIHMEVAEGVGDVPRTVSEQGRAVISFTMNMVESLHVHDSCSITSVAPEHIHMITGVTERWDEVMNKLKWCRVERCPRLDTVFVTTYEASCFSKLESFWASRLLMARSIWSRPRRPRSLDDPAFRSFGQLRAVHLHFCPRLRYVLVLSSNYDFPDQLETLHILCCGDLSCVFPVEQEFQQKIATSHEAQGMLQFPKLKDLYLHGLSSLRLICEAKMFAPKLETIRIRDCWGLRRLPATDGRRHRQDGRPVAVDCEKDWWDKLEWDGMESGHHPSLFQPRHSRYYRKRHLRRTVLR